MKRLLQVYQYSAKNRPKIVEHRPAIGPKSVPDGPKSVQNRPRSGPESTQNRCPAGFQHTFVFCDLFCTLFSSPKIGGGASWNFTQYFFTDFSTSSAILDPNIGPIWSRNRCRNGAPKRPETEEGVGIRFVLVFTSFCKHVSLEF